MFCTIEEIILASCLAKKLQYDLFDAENKYQNFLSTFLSRSINNFLVMIKNVREMNCSVQFYFYLEDQLTY